jgi:dipeptidyl aminopeptidase/acylaminoacyl peptidase
MEQYFSIASPLELNAAKKADRIAWITYEKGMRNVYTAAAPLWKPLRITKFLADDGQDLTDVTLSEDGTVAVFVRGSAPNRDGWIANPAQNPAGSERAIWAARTDGSGAWRLAEGANPQLSPDGRMVLYVKENQIYRARIGRGIVPDSMDRALKPFIREWGSQSNPRWSPDGRHIAFVSARTDHSFIGVYDMATRRVAYVSPSVDFDGSPTWSADSRQIAFTRRPGSPFGQQQRSPNDTARIRPEMTQIPGLFNATFPGGYTLSVMLADVAGIYQDIAQPAAREIWHNAKGDRKFASIGAMTWANGNLIFQQQAGGSGRGGRGTGAPGTTGTPGTPGAQGTPATQAVAVDEWERFYSLNVNGTSQPVLLTPTDGIIEDNTMYRVSADGRTFYYATNASDIERRDIWAVSTSGGTPRQVTRGDGIETYPQPIASGKQVAVLYFGAATPASVGIVNVESGATKLIYPTLPKDWPPHVTPQIVTLRSPDSLEIHNQLFLPRDMKAGEKRPAMVFVHGGPQRQMLPAYHYMQFYHWAYAYNQWLADQGYIVISVNYRSGVGYGRSFTRAPRTGRAGNSEYQDVLTAAKYLQSRPDVDASRIGIWGLSYGGQLTSEALARNSDIFVAGADLAGVHTLGPLDTANIGYKSASISQIDKWKSPVFLVHGDDDRNVAFTQTIGLVQLLRARGIYHELIVIPDDTHESMRYDRWVYTWNRMNDFLRRFVWQRQSVPVRTD